MCKNKYVLYNTVLRTVFAQVFVSVQVVRCNTTTQGLPELKFVVQGT
jgi:hypothetical protein